MTQAAPPPALPTGEVMGVLLLGVAQSFLDLHVIPGKELARLTEGVQPEAWYPLPRLSGLFNYLTETYEAPVREGILTRAGRNFMVAWRAGPGREVNGPLDFLRLQGAGAGYRSVVRGPCAEIGDVELEVLDLLAGHAVIRSTAPFPVAFECGIFLGGLCLYEAVIWSNLTLSMSPDGGERRLILDFRLRNPDIDESRLSAALADPDLACLTEAEVREVLWRHRGLMNAREQEASHWAQMSTLFIDTLDRLHAQAAEMTTLATTDSLTGVASRRQILEQGEYTRASCLQKGRTFAVLMIDIDHFKRFNDTHGHRLGDAVLRNFADQASAVLRDGDCLGRVGGEEFLAVLPDTGEEDAILVADRLREYIASHPLLWQARRYAVTVSIGLCTAGAESSLDLLVARADRALYMAKKAGRNRVAALGPLSVADLHRQPA
jgi:diguanylate cyclase (GGDEF)-like protein